MADYGTLARTLVQDNWTQLGNIRKLCTYVPRTQGAYDPTAEYSGTDGTTESVYMVFDKISTMYLDGQTIKETDRNALFPALDLTATPKEYDHIIDDTAKRWEVQRVEIDPAGALYTLRVRPIDGQN